MKSHGSEPIRSSNLDRNRSSRKSVYAKMSLAHETDVLDAFRPKITSKVPSQERLNSSGNLVTKKEVTNYPHSFVLKP